MVIDSNRRLTDLPHGTVAGSITTGGVELEASTPTSSLKFTPKLRFLRYNGNLGLDSNDHFLTLEGSHLFSPRHQLSLTAAHEEESSGTTDIEESRRNFSNVERITKSFAPNYTYIYDDRNSLQVGYSSSDVSYGQGVTGGSSDYSYEVGSVSGTHALSETDVLTGIFYRSDFDVPSALSETTSYAAQLSFSRQFNDSLKGTIGFGMITSTSDFTNRVFLTPTTFVDVPGSTSKSGKLIDISLEKSFEYTDVEASFSRSVSPSSRGAQNERDELDFNLVHRLSERMTGNANLNYYQNKSQSGTATGSLDRTFMRMKASLRYRLDQAWALNGGYQYREIEYDATSGSGGNPDSSTFFLSIVYRGDLRTISR